MLGYNSIITWLACFSVVSYFLVNYLNIKTVLLRVIFIWTFWMIFIAIFEMMLFFCSDYLENKGKEYYAENKCYWTEDNSICDAFSYKMYMNLYADYSLSDKRYCENFKTDEGNRFVFLGEVIHGFFCIFMAAVIFYFFLCRYNETHIYLAAIIFSAIQFALITWYMVSVFLEMGYKKNDQFFAYPLLWNVPWFVVPLYIIYYAWMELTKGSDLEKIE